MKSSVLRVVLGDQLNSKHSWFETVDENVIYLMAEVHEEATYVTHHIQKITGFFSAMRQFAQELKAKGHAVRYLKLDETTETPSFPDLIIQVVGELNVERVEYLLPDEFRLDQQFKGLQDQLAIPVRAFDTEHFLTERDEVASFFQGKKQWVMESFYRYMRKKHEVLMEDDKPETGKWNYDQENRKKLPKDQTLPEAFTCEHDVSDVVEMIKSMGIQTIGQVTPQQFIWPTNRELSLQLLDYFVQDCLPNFGKYQDAMTTKDWSLFHSRLSFSLNTKMIHPLEVVERVVGAYRQSQTVSIAQAEGFVRQLIGWREYMRGIYWAHMPNFSGMNFFDHRASLPKWYWNGKTNMKCLSHSIEQSLEYGYAHHIQRLMVTGNFALLAGVSPDEVDAWYLGIYMDAIEWVEITNTRGMSQFADGGIVGTKPYISSASYINKMSHYCKTCAYSHTKKTGEGSCPFNSLYWHFYQRNRDKLEKNPRVSMMYRVWDKMDAASQQALLHQAEHYLNRVDSL